MYLFFIIILLIVTIYCISNNDKTFKHTKTFKHDETFKHKEIKKNELKEMKKIDVILCYASWCSHCPMVKEWFVELVNESNNLITYKMIEEKQMPLKLYKMIEGFPTILIVVDNKVISYPGQRTKKDLLNYLKKM